MLKIAAVLFEDFEMLDLYGPLEMFSYFRKDFEITAIAERKGAIRSSGGPSTLAEVTFAERQDFDVLLVPGGAGVRVEKDNSAILEWLRSTSENARLVTSVCTGSLLLARADVLQGRKATTNKEAFDWVVENAPGVDWQRKARWVEDGKFITSSGVSAGIDMSLAVIEAILGPEAAENAAKWGEYIRNPDPDDDPFTKGAT